MRHAWAAIVLLAGCSAGESGEVVTTPPPDAPAPHAAAPLPDPTRILDHDTAHRLRNNSGITLQWIGWDERGQVEVGEDERGVWRLSGIQRAGDGAPGRVAVRGVVTEIGSDYFLLDGTVRIENAPDPGRLCERDKLWRFAVTQDRKYWRLREFEWCDYLTDYVDIYF